MIGKLFNLYDENEPDIINRYSEFLRFKSISSEPRYANEVVACSQWLLSYLQEMGMTVSSWPTESGATCDGGHPTIFAEWTGAGHDKPTVLIYGHYDVQPIDPLELWKSPPFTPMLKQGIMYARGASDNKGQIFYAIQAVKHCLQENKSLPVNVKFIIDGEEEIGSPGLSKLLSDKAKDIQADHLLIVDVGIADEQTPSVTIGVRGVLTMTLEFIGSNIDLHSGAFGGIAYNPNRAMVEVLAKMHSPDARIAIPGFYDDVIEVDESERKKLCAGITHDDFISKYGVHPCGGEIGYTSCENNWLRPTLEINGICGGYSGNGFKTVIPAKTTAKLSCRLVPNQQPDKIGSLVKDFITAHVPKGIVCNVELHPGVGIAARSDSNCKTVQSCVRAFTEVFGLETRIILDGATIPVASHLAEVSGAELALVGVSLTSDSIHAPNENFSLSRMRLGFVIMSRLLSILGKT